MQSLHVLRLLLNSVAFALALRASSQRAWSVVEPVTLRWPTGSSDVGTSRDLASEAAIPSNSSLVRLTFAPSKYCLDARNGSSDCHPYAYLLTQSDSDAPALNLSAIVNGGIDSDSGLVAASPSNRLRAAASGWCMASSSSGASGSWLLQGAQSMLCLVVLETCLYTSLLWLLFGGCSVLFSLSTILKCEGLEGCASSMTTTQASLGVLVLVEWSGYSIYMMDVGYVAVLQLVVHYGASFHLAAASVLSSLVACRISSKISSPLSSFNLARLSALPASPRSQRRQWSDGGSPQGSTSPEIEEEDATLDCLEHSVDPLKCAANYRV